MAASMVLAAAGATARYLAPIAVQAVMTRVVEPMVAYGKAKIDTTFNQATAYADYLQKNSSLSKTKTVAERVSESISLSLDLTLIPSAISYSALAFSQQGVGQAVSGVAKDAAGAYSFLRLPGAITQFVVSVEEVDRENPSKPAPIPLTVACGARFVECLPPVIDGFSLLARHEVIPLPKAFLGVVEVVGASLSGVLGLYGVIEESILLANIKATDANAESQTIWHVASLIKNIIYIALAALTLVAFVFSLVIAPWILAAVTAGALVCALFGFFYEKIADPNNQYGLRLEIPLPSNGEALSRQKVSPN